MFCPARSLVTNWLILARKWQQKQLIYTRRYTHSKDIDNRMCCIWWRGSWLQVYIILGWNDWKFEFCLKINQPKTISGFGTPTTSSPAPQRRAHSRPCATSPSKQTFFRPILFLSLHSQSSLITGEFQKTYLLLLWGPVPNQQLFFNIFIF